LNTQEILALYDSELRVEFQDPDLRKESLPLVVRLIRASPGMGFIRFSRLNEVNADAAIREQMAYFAEKNLPFEWDVFADDKPPDLEERLLAHGFKPDLEADDPGAVLVLDTTEARPPLLAPVTADVRQVVSQGHLDDVVHIEEHVWGGRFDWLKVRLEAHMAIPGYLSVWAAYLEANPAACGWLYFHPHSHFATLRGGSTLPAYRQRGLYTALLCVRVQQAIQRGYRFLTVDASPASRPILEKLGFQLLTYARSYKWQSGQEAAAPRPEAPR
jgi:GNAT superfamily N-acetyltransferase